MSHNPARRRWLLTAAAGIAGFSLAKIPAVSAATSRSVAAVPPHAAPRLKTAQVATDLLDIGYYTAGPEDGRPVVLLHDFGYDIDSYAEVASLLAAQGLHVIVPYLRGHGSTRFLDSAAIRSGQPAALGYDAIGVFDALHIPEVVIAGFGWGARAAMAAAALKPTRIRGLVVVDDYLEYGEVPSGRSSAALENPDYLAVTTHAYRYHQGQAPGDPQYDNAEKKLALQTPVAATSITLQRGDSSAANDSADDARFSGPHRRVHVAGTGRNLLQEAPRAFADAVAEVVRQATWRT